MAIAYVGGTFFSVTQGTTGTFTYASTAGNTLVAVVIIQNTTRTVSTIGGGGGWALRAAVNGSNIRGEIWSQTAGGNPGAASNLVTISGQATDTISGDLLEFSGVLQLGGTATNFATSTNPTVSRAITTGGDYIAGGAGSQLNNATSNGTGTRVSPYAFGSGQNFDVSGAGIYNTSGSPGSLTISIGENSAPWVALALELRATIAAATPGDDDDGNQLLWMPSRPVLFVPTARLFIFDDDFAPPPPAFDEESDPPTIQAKPWAWPGTAPLSPTLVDYGDEDKPIGIVPIEEEGEVFPVPVVQTNPQSPVFSDDDVPVAVVSTVVDEESEILPAIPIVSSTPQSRVFDFGDEVPTQIDEEVTTPAVVVRAAYAPPSPVVFDFGDEVPTQIDEEVTPPLMVARPAYAQPSPVVFLEDEVPIGIVPIEEEGAWPTPPLMPANNARLQPTAIFDDSEVPVPPTTNDDDGNWPWASLTPAVNPTLLPTPQQKDAEVPIGIVPIDDDTSPAPAPVRAWAQPAPQLFDDSDIPTAVAASAVDEDPWPKAALTLSTNVPAPLRFDDSEVPSQVEEEATLLPSPPLPQWVARAREFFDDSEVSTRVEDEPTLLPTAPLPTWSAPPSRVYDSGDELHVVVSDEDYKQWPLPAPLQYTIPIGGFVDHEQVAIPPPPMVEDESGFLFRARAPTPWVAISPTWWGVDEEVTGPLVIPVGVLGATSSVNPLGASSTGNPATSDSISPRLTAIVIRGGNS